jgi:hypothetical protein
LLSVFTNRLRGYAWRCPMLWFKTMFVKQHNLTQCDIIMFTALPSTAHCVGASAYTL